MQMAEQVTGDLGGLKEKIISQAKERCRESLSQAKAQAEEIIQKAKSQGEKATTQILQQAKTQAQERQRQLLINASLKRRKETLQAQRTLLEQAFDEAISSFAELSEEEYQEFIKALLVTSQDQACHQIAISSGEERINPQFIAEVAGELGWQLELVREDDPRLEAGGFLLRGNKLEIDVTIPTILGLIRPGLEGDVAQILFGEL